MLLRPLGFRKLCHARDLLREVPEDAMTVEGIAAAVGISPAHFIRQFDALFGVTPHQFRLRARLDLAKELLARGEHSVTDVCMAVGFSSLGSFSTTFSRRIGESPSAYRRRMRPFVQVPGLAPEQRFPGCLGLLAHLPVGSQFSRSFVAHSMPDSWLDTQ